MRPSPSPSPSTLLLAIALLSCTATVKAADAAAFGLAGVTSGSGYAGRVPESTDEDDVDDKRTDGGGGVAVVGLTPGPIRTQGELVCMFRIVKHHNIDPPPFEITIADQYQGLAELRSTRPLDCEATSAQEENEEEKRRSFHFQIEAVSCSGTYSERIPVRVDVSDVNEYPPRFPADSVRASVAEEEAVGTEVVQLEAKDDDCGEYGDICSYEIETESQPFDIDGKGVLRNTEPLNYTSSHSHVLSVVATDCGGKKSAPVLVIVEVRPPCHTGWSVVASQISYVPSTGPQPLYPQAKFDLCPSEKCTATNYESTLTLETRHIGKGCDRDTYDLASQRHLCGASGEAVDLLAPSATISNEIRDNRVRRDAGSGAMSDASVTRFDGSSGLDLPDTIVNPESFPGRMFTVATWMRHAGREDGDNHVKEHIVCEADDHEKNRHHTALFVRNCKLVLLLRREYVEGEENVFKPAEWRWKLPQVCDNEWHHYAVSVNFPNAELTVDGDRWEPEGTDNPEIIDDWPLHKVAGLSTKVTVGACYQGGEDGYKHGLNGYLAGLSFLPNANENSEVLRCLHQCAESLQVPTTGSIESGMEMVSDNRGARVVVDGPNEQDLTRLVRQIAYLNTREFPSPGRRIVRLSTRVNCADGRAIDAPEQSSFVNVVAVPEPGIEISGGSPDLHKDYEEFKLGVPLFSGIKVVMTTGGGGSSNYIQGGEPVNGIDQRLDECRVAVTPPLNSDHESLAAPEDLLRSLGITGESTVDGAVFRGAEMIYNYERLLRQVTYTNRKPAYYLNRKFTVICSEMNGRFISNEYIQTITVVHPVLADDDNVKEASEDSGPASFGQVFEPRSAHRAMSAHGVDQIGFEERHILHAVRQHGSHGNLVAIVAVVCVGLMAFLLVLGVVRIRASQRRSETAGEAADAAGEMEMAWDDTALKITVNPMEQGTQESTSNGALMPLASATGFPNPSASALATLRENPLQSGAANCDEDCYDDDDDDSLSDEVDSDDLDDLYDEDDDDVDDDDVVEDEVVVRSGRAVARRSTRSSRIGCNRLDWDNSSI